MKVGVHGAFVLALGLLAGLTPRVARAGGAGGDDGGVGKFKEKYASQNSWDKLEGVKALHAENPDALKQILKVCDTADWFLRGACIDLLSGKLDAKAQDELRKIVKAGKATGEIEIIALAFGRSKDEGYIDDLVATIKKKDTDWRVKRACAISLGLLPSKKSIAALVDEFEVQEKAKSFVVYVHIIEALEKLTQEKDKKTAKDWKEWWTGAESSWGEKKSDDEEAGKSGEVLHTVSRGADLTFRARGKGRPVLVLPDSDLEKDYLETYLRGLESSYQLLYMRLPGVKDFKDPELKPEGNSPNPKFPLDRLVEAFEDMRKELIKNKKIEDKPLSLFAHGGQDGWVAIRYASKHPEAIARLALCGTYTSDRSWQKASKLMRLNGQATGDIELDHAGGQMIFNGQKGKRDYETSSHEEELALDRKTFTICFANPQDLEIGRILGPMVAKPGYPGEWPKYMRIDARAYDITGAFDLNKEPEISCPVLVMSGDRAQYLGCPDDAAEVKNHYPKSVLQIFKGCGTMPFIEDNKTFTAVMEKFLH